MASTVSIIRENSDKQEEKRLMKRRRIDSVDQTTTTTTTTTSVPSLSKWRSQTAQRTYSCKLMHALRHLRGGQTTSCSAPRRGRAVREEADEVLAVVARGRTRWSRAILAKRMKLRMKKHKKVRVKSKWVSTTGCSRLSGAGVHERRDKLPAVDKRVKVLGRLVPGCRKVSLANLLEETIDYIGAVQMQVRAMTAITELLIASQTSSDGTEPGSTGSLEPV